MSDYSLHHVNSRPAKIGDRLTTRNFGLGTRGLLPPTRSTWLSAFCPGRSCPLQTRLGEKAPCPPGVRTSNTKLRSSGK